MPKYTEAEVEAAISALDMRASNPQSIGGDDTAFTLNPLAWRTIDAVDAIEAATYRSVESLQIDYAEAAALLRDGWRPGHRLFDLSDPAQPEITSRVLDDDEADPDVE